MVNIYTAHARSAQEASLFVAFGCAVREDAPALVVVLLPRRAEAQVDYNDNSIAATKAAEAKATATKRRQQTRPTENQADSNQGNNMLNKRRPLVQ